MAIPPRSVRRGLPRRPGGEPWPPVSPHALSSGAAPAPSEPHVATFLAPAAAPSEPAATSVSVAPERPRATADAAAPAVEPVSSRPVRRGLPRVSGGAPWPPEGFAPAHSAVVAPAADDVAPPPRAPRPPLSFRPTVFPGVAARSRPEPAPEPRRYGPFTRGQWVGAIGVGGGILLIVAAMLVAGVRWILSLPALQDFLVTYPGEYPLPASAPVGVPAWLGWQHFLNAFFLLLIIRSGLRVRSEKRPAVLWSPRGDARRKISLTLWFHQSLDILWVVNGAAFVVLLFVTGQWMRIVPTSWEVLPNALSAALQYVSLDWPTENGWVNYNALQQLAYFSIVFVAAPLAIVSGVRMSGIWPKGAVSLTSAYPVEWARKIHFPVMLYFVAFIAIHVILVFATGALRNLNHMYAALGSTDPDAYTDDATGFWFFFASLAVMAAAWVAARPLVLAPIAGLFGSVKRA